MGADGALARLDAVGGLMTDENLMCVSCGRGLERRDVREAVVRTVRFPKGVLCGPLCVGCVQPLLDDVPCEQGLDDQWARKRLH